MMKTAAINVKKYLFISQIAWEKFMNMTIGAQVSHKEIKSFNPQGLSHAVI